jgi:hypothetical protein
MPMFHHKDLRDMPFRAGFTILLKENETGINKLLPYFSKMTFVTDKVNNEIIQIPKMEYIPIRGFSLCTVKYRQKGILSWFDKTIQKPMPEFVSEKVHYSFTRKLAVLEGKVNNSKFFVVISRTNNENIGREAIKRWAKQGAYKQTLSFTHKFPCSIHIATTDDDGQCSEYHSHLPNPIRFHLKY